MPFKLLAMNCIHQYKSAKYGEKILFTILFSHEKKLDLGSCCKIFFVTVYFDLVHESSAAAVFESLSKGESVTVQCKEYIFEVIISIVWRAAPFQT